MELSLRTLLKRFRPPSDQSGDTDWCARGTAHYDKRRYLRALEDWKKASAQGNQEARYRIGLLYARGEGVVRSAPDAVAWYRLAAQAGHADAQYQLGLSYLNGGSPAAIGPEDWFRAASQHDSASAQRTIQILFPNGIAVAKDHDEAMRWIRAAATAGKVEAQALLGEMYRRGVGCTQDHAEAQHWYGLAAQQGVASAQFAMGDVFYQGLGVAADHKLAAEWYEKAARNGDPRAQVALGSMYLDGDGLPADPKEAARYFVLAAERGDARGLYQAALMHINGDWLPNNVDKGETFLRKSAKQDYLPAIIRLAEFYAHGKSVEPDLRESGEWYRRAAELGDVRSQFIMGRLYANGAGVPVNFRESARWLLLAAKQGHATAAHNVAAHFANGTGVERDPIKAIEWYKVAAAQGITASQVQLGKMYSTGEGVARDVTLATEWLRKAVESGDPEAKTTLAMFHLQGRPVIDNSSEAEQLLRQAAESGHPAAAMQLARLYAREAKPDEAVTWYKKAAESGHVEAQYALGMLYFNGRGVKTDLAAAASWIKKAAAVDHAPAQFQLAVMYCRAEGVPKDLERAVAWYECAARSGHGVAQYNLAVMLSRGQGREPDPPQALSWFQKAAAQGVEQARLALSKIPSEDPRAVAATNSPASPPKLGQILRQPATESVRQNQNLTERSSPNLADADPDARSPMISSHSLPHELGQNAPAGLDDVTPLPAPQGRNVIAAFSLSEMHNVANISNDLSKFPALTPAFPSRDIIQQSTVVPIAETSSGTNATDVSKGELPETPSAPPVSILPVATQESPDQGKLTSELSAGAPRNESIDSPTQEESQSICNRLVTQSADRPVSPTEVLQNHTIQLERANGSFTRPSSPNMVDADPHHCNPERPLSRAKPSEPEQVEPCELHEVIPELPARSGPAEGTAAYSTDELPAALQSGPTDTPLELKSPTTGEAKQSSYGNLTERQAGHQGGPPMPAETAGSSTLSRDGSSKLLQQWIPIANSETCESQMLNAGCERNISNVIPPALPDAEPHTAFLEGVRRAILSLKVAQNVCDGPDSDRLDDDQANNEHVVQPLHKTDPGFQEAAPVKAQGPGATAAGPVTLQIGRTDGTVGSHIGPYPREPSRVRSKAEIRAALGLDSKLPSASKSPTHQTMDRRDRPRQEDE